MTQVMPETTSDQGFQGRTWVPTGTPRTFTRSRDPNVSPAVLQDDVIYRIGRSPRYLHSQADPATGSVDNVRPTARLAIKIQKTIHKTYIDNKNCLKKTLIGLLIAGYAVYFGYAVQHNWEGSKPLIVFTALGLLFALYSVAGETVTDRIQHQWHRLISSSSAKKVLAVPRWVVPVVILACIFIFIIVDKREKPYHLLSALGIIVFIFTSAIISKNTVKIEWKVVLHGLLIQFILGLVTLRWSHGYSALEWLGDQITLFLAYSDVGSRFVFGESFTDHDMIFRVLTVIIFFGAVVELLYYFGVLQRLILALGSVMIVLMGVGPIESFVSAANVFLGPNNSALTVARFLDSMTLSELHCVMTSGFATVTGSLFGAYVEFGVSPSHLVAASLMSAPAAICVSKIIYPETEESTLKDVKTLTFPKSEYHNPIHALYGGAKECGKIVAHISANLIGFVAGLALFNATLEWFGDRVGVQGLTFQWLCSYLFIPLPFLMGIETSDCREVARLIGTKLFLTDIIGYKELGKLIKTREKGLDGPTISPRSEVIATYALCGFANFPDVSICLAAIGAIAPSRKGDLARVAARAAVAGNVACFITACLAGLLYNG